jgi:hypothetical protein
LGQESNQLFDSETLENNVAVMIDDSFLHGAFFPLEGNDKTVQVIIRESNFGNSGEFHYLLESEFGIKHEHTLHIEHEILFEFTAVL